MNITELFENINNAYRGSDDDAPKVNTPDYKLWINTTNRKIFEWARDSKNTWRSLYDKRLVGTVSLGTQDYDLDDNFLNASDSVLITAVNGNEYRYTICEPQQRDRYFHSAYIHGTNPQVLTFGTSILADNPIIGGTIYMPGYYLPDPITKASDLVPVDDPYWLVDAVASELAFNDITYAAKSADLNARSNNLYSIMASNNRRGSSDSPRQIRTMVDPIPDTRTSRIANRTGSNF